MNDPGVFVSPTEAARIARLPIRGLTEREIIIRIGLILDAAQRQFDELHRLGTITTEFRLRANDTISTVAADLANIPKR